MAEETYLEIYISHPVGSLIRQPEEVERRYLDAFFEMPHSLQNMLFSRRTASYIRGLVKTYDVPLDQSHRIAFIVMRVAVGEIELAKLAGVLSGELKLANDKAQRLAKDIEKELFAPVMKDFNEWLASGRQAASAGEAANEAGAQNIIDLKTKK